MTTAYIRHPLCHQHDMGAKHPECPERLSAIDWQLLNSGLLAHLVRYDAVKVTQDQLARVHTTDYIAWVFNQAPKSGLRYLDVDTAMNAHSLNAALYAAGAVVQAVDLVMSGEAHNAFCSIRPPGHHAGRASAAGFCIFNNIAVGVAHALRFYGLQRVAIVDFDVHHGNGTENIFQDNPKVLLCSSFRHPYYPYCGADSGNVHIINTPLAAGSSGNAFKSVVTERWLPALEEFQPQFVFISAGFDAHYEDRMGGLKLTEEDYVWVTEIIKDMADSYADGRIVSALEGGYALNALGRCVAAHIATLSTV